MSNVYDFTVKDRMGNDVSLKDYEGKVLLIVNTATGCGFTPHYEPLEAMYKEYRDKGFEILDSSVCLSGIREAFQRFRQGPEECRSQQVRSGQQQEVR